MILSFELGYNLCSNTILHKCFSYVFHKMFTHKYLQVLHDVVLYQGYTPTYIIIICNGFYINYLYIDNFLKLLG